MLYHYRFRWLLISAPVRSSTVSHIRVIIWSDVVNSHYLQVSFTIAKMTARCALYIGYSTLILFTPIRPLLCAELVLNEFKLIRFIALIGCWFYHFKRIANSSVTSSTQWRMPSINAQCSIAPGTQNSCSKFVLIVLDVPPRWNPSEYPHMPYISRN